MTSKARRPASPPRRRTVAAAALLTVLVGCGGGSAAPSRTATSAATSRTPVSSSLPSPAGARPVPSVPHVMVVMEENRGFAATLGSCGDAPYWCSLAAAYSSATAWFAVAHPSLPNYLAMESGSTQGCSSDGCSGDYAAQDLGGQLSAAGIPWTAYMESMPSPCYQGSSAGPYARKHNPFAYFADNNATCHVRPYPGAAGLVGALAATAAPDFVWISPNVNNDMHDGTVQQGDAWLRANLAGVLSSSWFGNGGTVIITMDENDASSGPGGGRIPLVVLSSRSKGAGPVPTAGNGPPAEGRRVRTPQDSWDAGLRARKLSSCDLWRSTAWAVQP